MTYNLESQVATTNLENENELLYKNSELKKLNNDNSQVKRAALNDLTGHLNSKPDSIETSQNVLAAANPLKQNFSNYTQQSHSIPNTSQLHPSKASFNNSVSYDTESSGTDSESNLNYEEYANSISDEEHPGNLDSDELTAKFYVTHDHAKSPHGSVFQENIDIDDDYHGEGDDEGDDDNIEAEMEDDEYYNDLTDEEVIDEYYGDNNRSQIPEQVYEQYQREQKILGEAHESKKRRQQELEKAFDEPYKAEKRRQQQEQEEKLRTLERIQTQLKREQDSLATIAAQQDQQQQQRYYNNKKFAGECQNVEAGQRHEDDDNDDDEEEENEDEAEQYYDQNNLDESAEQIPRAFVIKRSRKIDTELYDVYKSFHMDHLDPDDEDTYEASMVAEYSAEIFNYMHKLELRLRPNPRYMENQHEIKWYFRSKLVDWLVQIHSQFRLLPETLFLTINYIDRFLSKRKVSLSRFQLVGLVALFIAAKYEEINCPSLKEIVQMSDYVYSEDEIIRAEKFMIDVLNFDMGWPGPMSFLRRTSKADDYDFETRTLAKYLLETTIMDYKFVDALPSWLAAGAHFLSRIILNRGDWTPAHVYYSGYTAEQLTPLAFHILECCRSAKMHHSAVYEKYERSGYKKASLFVQRWLKAVEEEEEEIEDEEEKRE